MMIRQVEITRRVEKQARKLPVHISEKLGAWVYLVKEIGLEEARKVPGYHDEPLVGRRRGMRSIRLSRSYRAMYRLLHESDVVIVSIEEVNKHGY